MANLKIIRKRISTVKSTQKITRAMKMVAGARLNRAQQRILALRPYAVKTAEALAEITTSEERRMGAAVAPDHPLLARREEKSVLYLVITSDRGLCGAFNSNILRRAERLWREGEASGKKVQIAYDRQKRPRLFQAAKGAAFSRVLGRLGTPRPGAGAARRSQGAPAVRRRRGRRDLSRLQRVQERDDAAGGGGAAVPDLEAERRAATEENPRQSSSANSSSSRPRRRCSSAWCRCTSRSRSCAHSSSRWHPSSARA